MCGVGLPSFSFPMHLPAVQLEVFKFSALLALLAYTMGPFLVYYRRHLKDWGQRTLFAMEKVVKEPGEMSDDLDTQEPLREREFTGREQLAKYWRVQST